jgi:hypothetical protein
LILEGEALLLIDGKPGPTHIFRPATKGARIPVLHRQAVAVMLPFTMATR